MTLEGECLVNPKHKTVLDELERECLRVRAMETPAAAQHGANQHSGGVDEKNNVNSKVKGGNSSEYRISRLKRDHPDIAKRVEAGEFTQAVQDETGKTPKAWYEEKLRPAHAKIATAQADPESGEFVNPKGGRPKKGETCGNTTGFDPHNAKPYILRRLARERPDLLDRFELDHPTRTGARPTAAATFCRRLKSASSRTPAASSSTTSPLTVSTTCCNGRILTGTVPRALRPSSSSR